MTQSEFYEKLNKLFAEKDIEKVGDFLDSELKSAREANDNELHLIVLNEAIGFNRDTGNADKSILYCDEAVSLMRDMNMEGTVEYATSLQNIANAYRAAGKKVESLGYYNNVFKIYREKLDENDYRFASLHNNIALLYHHLHATTLCKHQRHISLLTADEPFGLLWGVQHVVAVVVLVQFLAQLLNTLYFVHCMI